MSDLIVFYDDTDVTRIPANATHVAYYVDGRYKNETEMKARFPHAQMISITTTGGAAEAADCEKGDLTIDEVVAWVGRRLAVGAYKPIVYANQDTWENQGLQAKLAHYSGKIRRWLAAWNGQDTLPDGYDAHQYATGVLDTNVSLPSFFDKEAPKPAHDSGVAVAQIKINLKTGVPHIHRMPGTAKFAGAKHEYEFHGTLAGGHGGGTWAVKRGA